MAKTFYTERDVEDLHRQGIMTITLTDDIVMTDLAYEKARRLEMKMVQAQDAPPAAPIRPYINTPSKSCDRNPSLRGSTPLRRTARDVWRSSKPECARRSKRAWAAVWMAPCWMRSLSVWQKTWGLAEHAFRTSEGHCGLHAEIPGSGRIEAPDRAAFKQAPANRRERCR